MATESSPTGHQQFHQQRQKLLLYIPIAVAKLYLVGPGFTGQKTFFQSHTTKFVGIQHTMLSIDAPVNNVVIVRQHCSYWKLCCRYTIAAGTYRLSQPLKIEKTVDFVLSASPDGVQLIAEQPTWIALFSNRNVTVQGPFYMDAYPYFGSTQVTLFHRQEMSHICAEQMGGPALIFIVYKLWCSDSFTTRQSGRAVTELLKLDWDATPFELTVVCTGLNVNFKLRATRIEPYIRWEDMYLSRQDVRYRRWVNG